LERVPGNSLQTKGREASFALIQFVQTYAKELSGLAFVIIAWALNRYGRSRARLFYTIQHAATTWVDEPLKDAEGKQLAPRQPIHTAAVGVTNAGLETAKNVEVVFNWKPMFLNVWPVRAYEERPSAHDTYSLLIPSLAPGEAVVINLVSINAGLPGLATVRCDEATAVQKNMTLQEVHPRWKLMLVAWFIIAGAAATGYGLAYIIQLISAG
jgi:hypothetical protein